MTTQSRASLVPSLASLSVLLAIAGVFGCAKVKETTPGGGTGGVGAPPPITGLTSLKILPDSQTITLSQSGTALSGSATFHAQGTKMDGSTSDVSSQVGWTINPHPGNGVNGGVVNVTAPGVFTITAQSGAISATATLTATFSGNFYGNGFNQGSASKLDGSSSGQATIAYPLDGAIFPSNFGPITIQIQRPGSEDLARLAWSGDGLDVKYYGTCEAGAPGAGCYVTLPVMFTGLFVAASTNHDVTLTARVVSSTGGSLSESPSIKLAWAGIPLSGGLYYWTTILCDSISSCPIPGYMATDAADIDKPTGKVRGTAVMRYNFDGDASKPDVVYTDQGMQKAFTAGAKTIPAFGGSPPALAGTDSTASPAQSWGEGRCIGCHAISFDGKLMAFSIGGSYASSFGLLDISMASLSELDPNAASTNDTGIQYLKRFRRGNFATFTTFGPAPVDMTAPPLMVNSYRGVLTLHEANAGLAVLADNLFGSATTERKTDPFWSPDGSHFAFTSYNPSDDNQTSQNNGDTKTGGRIWIATAAAAGPHDDAHVLVDRAPGVTNYYPAISHDSQLVVFNKSSCTGGTTQNGYGDKPCDGYDDISATLWLTNPAGMTPLKLQKAGGGDSYSDSWPRWSPDNGTFRGQRLYWLAFSSRRPYGLQVNSGAGTGAKPQLWFTAVSVGNEFATDPSAPPVWLPNQNLSQSLPTGNHVPQWVKFAVVIP